MKNVGVPATPLSLALSTSRSTRSANWRVCRCLLEAGHVEADLDGAVDEIDDAEGRLPVEQPIVHLPERALLTGGFGRLGRLFGVLVHVDEWEMPEHVAQFATRGREELADHRLGLAAVRALEVAVLDQRDGGVGGTSDVVALGIDRTERSMRARRSSLARARESIGQPLDDAEHEPAEQRRQRPTHRGSRAGRPELLALERDVGDEQRDREPDAGDGRRADERRPGDRQREPPEPASSARARSRR